MRDFLAITSALSDATRVRALVALRSGELCLCQLIDLLGLSPSTVSKHLSILHQAGLVTRRKEGRWHYYRLATGRDAPPIVRRALRWMLDALADEHVIVTDAAELCAVREKDLAELCSCYATK